QVQKAVDDEAHVTYGLTTLNGFRIEYQPGCGVRKNGETEYTFTVLHPDGPGRKCTVALPTFMKELVKAHADMEVLPHGERFWESMCEAALANYLYQHSELAPEEGVLVDELTGSIRKWVDAVL